MFDINEKYLKIGEAAEYLCVSEQTLRNYHRRGILVPDRVRSSGHREYSQSQLDDFLKKEMEA